MLGTGPIALFTYFFYKNKNVLNINQYCSGFTYYTNCTHYIDHILSQIACHDVFHKCDKISIHSTIEEIFCIFSFLTTYTDPYQTNNCYKKIAAYLRNS